MASDFFESIPMLGVYAFISVFILLACEGGFQLGRWHRHSQTDQEAAASIGPMVAGLLGMLAFLLAFAFSIAQEQHGARRENVLAEANMIGTAYLRADLLSPQHGEPVRRLLREYVDLRLRAAEPDADVQAVLRRSTQIHKALWVHAAAAAHEERDDITALCVESINQVIEMHERRLTVALRARVPGVVWVGLVGITLLTMLTLGLQLGLTGKRRILAIALLSLAFGALVTLIVDLNRPQAGMIKVGQQAMVSLRESMGPAPPAE
jgi:hypothetical protein